jgi:hypothetical protein
MLDERTAHRMLKRHFPPRITRGVTWSMAAEVMISPAANPIASRRTKAQMSTLNLQVRPHDNTFDILKTKSDR